MKWRQIFPEQYSESKTDPQHFLAQIHVAITTFTDAVKITGTNSSTENIESLEQMLTLLYEAAEDITAIINNPEQLDFFQQAIEVSMSQSPKDQILFAKFATQGRELIRVPSETQEEQQGGLISSIINIFNYIFSYSYGLSEKISNKTSNKVVPGMVDFRQSELLFESLSDRHKDLYNLYNDDDPYLF